MTDTTTDIAEWYAEHQAIAAEFLRMMRLRLADAPDRVEALYVTHRLAPEDLTVEDLAAMWLVTAADLIDAQAEVERLREHSVWLNTISWKIAEALGEVPAGAGAIAGNPVVQAQQLVDQLAEVKAHLFSEVIRVERMAYERGKVMDLCHRTALTIGGAAFGLTGNYVRAADILEVLDGSHAAEAVGDGV